MGNIADSLNNYWKVANKPHQEDATIHVTGAEKSAWNGKQDALRGTQGQIVGFDADGKPEAQDAPATGVTSFNGRSGAVSPRPGDYSAKDVGADPAGSADAVQGNLTSHAGNASHISVEEREAWNAKENGGAAAAVQGNLNAHTGDTNNPHSVTAAQAGAIPAPSESGSAGQVLMLDEDGKTPIWGTVSGGGSSKLDRIYVDTQPSKTAYKAGELFDPDGMVVKADYAIGGVVITQGVEITGYTWPQTPLYAGQNKVTISFTDSGVTKTADAAISVTKTAVPVPSFAQKLYYTGNIQTFVITDEPSGAVATKTGDASGLAAGDYTLHYELNDPDLFEWADKSFNGDVICAIQKAAVAAVPTQTGSLTYNGQTLTPVWSSYTAGSLTIGGEQSGVNANTYTANFTPTANYQWSDGGTEARDATWAIGKATGTLSLDATTVALSDSTTSVDVIISTNSDGQITATPKDSSSAKATVTGKTVKIETVGNTPKDTSVTISVAEGTNWTKPSDKNVTVRMSFLPPKGKKLEEYTWYEIWQISNTYGARNYFEIGDTKSIKLSGTMGTLSLNTTLYCYIIGIRHEKQVGITFGTWKNSSGKDVCLVDSKYMQEGFGGKYFSMNHWGDNTYGGWGGCDLRYDVLGGTDTPPSDYGKTHTESCVGYDASETTATNPVPNTLMSCLPAELRNMMRPLQERSNNTGGGAGEIEDMGYLADYLSLLAEYEIYGKTEYSSEYEGDDLEQYEYYKNGNSRLKYKHSSTSTAANWWLRSPAIEQNRNFCYAPNKDTMACGGALLSMGIAPVFKV